MRAFAFLFANDVSLNGLDDWLTSNIFVISASPKNWHSISGDFTELRLSGTIIFFAGIILF